MATFTDFFIDNLKPKAHRYDVREGNREGFSIRVSPGGRKTWQMIYTHQGKKRRMTLGVYPAIKLKEARSRLRAARNLIDEGIDPIEHADEIERQEAEAQRREVEAAEIEAREPTIATLAHDYLEKWSKPRKRSSDEDERILKKDVIPAWGDRKAKEITRKDVVHLLDSIVDRGAEIQANRTLAVIRKMYNFGIGRDLVDTTPCLQIHAPAKENRRERVLTQDEIKTFWAALHSLKMADGTKLALKLQLVTAQRIGEVASARWSDIDLKGGWWTIPAERSKNGMEHRVPLSRLAKQILKDAQVLAADSEWVFPSPKGDKPITVPALSHALRVNKDQIQAEHFTPHDLRRTAASHMTASGTPRLTVSKILNHVEPGVTAVYDRYSYDAEKKKALDAWGSKIEKLIRAKTELG